jgi:DNA polymerase-1
MSTTAQFLQDLFVSGIQVVLQNGRLHVRAPQGALTEDTRWLLRERRDELLAWLSMAEVSSDSLTPDTTGAAVPVVSATAFAPAPSDSSPLTCVTTAGTFLSTIVSLAHAHCAHPGRVAIDLETTGLDPRRHKVVSIALGVPGHVTILDVRPYYAQPPEEQARWCEALHLLLQYGGTAWVGQNLTFDWQFLAAHFGAHLDTVYDTMLAEQVLYGAKQERGRAGFGLRDIAARYQIPVSKEGRSWFEDLDKRPSEWVAPFPDEQVRYMIQDIEVPYRIAGMQQDLLERHQLQQIATLEYTCLPALAAIELHGTLIDRERWRQALQRKEARRDALAARLLEKLSEPLAQVREQRVGVYQRYQQTRHAEEKRLMRVYTTDEAIRRAQSWEAFRTQALQAWMGEHPAPPKPPPANQPINLGSSAQLLAVLAQMGIAVTSTKEEVLDAYADAHPMVAELLAWRELDHFCNAFGEKLLQHVQDDGRIHAHFAQVGAVSGRIICSKPNLQQIPKKREQEDEDEDIRRCFVAPAGSLLIKSDLSNIELRILAEVSRDETMLRFFAERRDLHEETAMLMFRLPPGTNTREHLYQGVVVREIAKTINYGLAYGMGAQSLAGRVNVSIEEARKLMTTYFQTYPGVDRWLRQAARQAHKQGYAASCSGRKRFFSFTGVNKGEQGSLERMARNHPIQATNADILKRAMGYLYDILPEGSHLVLVVHDEIVIECPEALVEETTALLKEALVEACRADLKLVHIPEPEVLVAPYWKKG